MSSGILGSSKQEICLVPRAAPPSVPKSPGCVVAPGAFSLHGDYTSKIPVFPRTRLLARLIAGCGLRLRLTRSHPPPPRKVESRRGIFSGCPSTAPSHHALAILRPKPSARGLPRRVAAAGLAPPRGPRAQGARPLGNPCPHRVAGCRNSPMGCGRTMRHPPGCALETAEIPELRTKRQDRGVSRFA